MRKQKMQASRRNLVRFIAAIGVLAAAGVVRAQHYPSRPVRLIVPFPAGGPSDIVARMIGRELSERFSQPFVVENRPGASGNIGTQSVAIAPADGHTLLLVAAPNAINAALYPDPAVDFMRDIAPVASLAHGALIMLVTPSFPAETVPQFIAHALANPARINMASPGKGTPPHVAGELFKALTGVNMVHVPYRGVAPAITDLLSGQVHVLFDPVPSSIGYVRAGRLRALAVTTTQRSELLPETPALAEFLPGYEASTWFGIGTPRRTPLEIIEQLNNAINEILAKPALKARLTDLGATTLAGSPADFRRFLRTEVEKWAKVIADAGIKPD